VFVLSALISALWLAWSALRSFDFAFDFWYSALQLEQKIAYYAPNNRFRFAFENTSYETRKNIYQQISRNIHIEGAHFDQIIYNTKDGKVTDYFLTAPEIQHLEDVNHLITKVHWTAPVAAALFLSICGFYTLKPSAKFSLRAQGMVMSVLILLLSAPLFVFGPQKIFDILHQTIFPADHPWFFFYEDSLMTLLMYAPYSFAVIAALWGGISLLFFGVLTFMGLNVNKVTMKYGRKSKN
jgi:uncharacterized membrane protein